MMKPIGSLLAGTKIGRKLRHRAILLIEKVLYRSKHNYPRRSQSRLSEILSRNNPQTNIVCVKSYTEIADDNSIGYLLSNGNVAMLFSDFSTLYRKKSKRKYTLIDYSQCVITPKYNSVNELENLHFIQKVKKKQIFILI